MKLKEIFKKVEQSNEINALAGNIRVAVLFADDKFYTRERYFETYQDIRRYIREEYNDWAATAFLYNNWTARTETPGIWDMEVGVPFDERYKKIHYQIQLTTRD